MQQTHGGGLQGYSDPETSALWRLIFEVLELDRKSRYDMFLLAQSGIAGRTCAQEILWTLLTVQGPDPGYEDLSHWVSNKVNFARMDFDRPPEDHPDYQKWDWTRYLDNYYEDNVFNPRKAPQGPYSVIVGEGGAPLKPPDCWRLHVPRKGAKPVPPSEAPWPGLD